MSIVLLSRRGLGVGGVAASLKPPLEKEQAWISLFPAVWGYFVGNVIRWH